METQTQTISEAGRAILAATDARNATELARHNVVEIAEHTHTDPDDWQGLPITEPMVWCSCNSHGRCGLPQAQVPLLAVGDSFPQCPCHNGPFAPELSFADWQAWVGVGPWTGVFEPDTD